PDFAPYTTYASVTQYESYRRKRDASYLDTSVMLVNYAVANSSHGLDPIFDTALATAINARHARFALTHNSEDLEFVAWALVQRIARQPESVENLAGI